MVEEIVACLDGSRRAESILPLVQGIATAKGATLTALRVVSDPDELSAEESYMCEQARLFGARVKFVVSPEPANAIIEELRKNPRAMAALTTHGRTAWIEAIIGSVALKVIRGAGRPVLLYRPHAGSWDSPRNITTIIFALDGSEFSEKIIPFAVEMAKSIKAKITLVQALPVSVERTFPVHLKTDITEDSYLRSTAAEIKRKYGIEPSWDTLHGDPGEAICRYVGGMNDTMLAMTSHARGGLERAFLGSVAANCIRNAEVPILLYWC